MDLPNRIAQTGGAWGICWEYQPDPDGWGTPLFYVSDAEGAYLGPIPGPPTPRGYIDWPGSLYYEDPPGTWHSTIRFVDDYGQTISEVELEGAPDKASQDAWVDTAGRIYLSTTYLEPEVTSGPAILAYSPTGALLQEIRFTDAEWRADLPSQFITPSGAIYGFEWHADSVDIVKYSPPEG